MLCIKLDTVEKKTYGYQERDELQREAFKERLKTALPHYSRVCRRSRDR